MPKYMLAYHGGKKPESDADCTEHMQKWQEWVSALGDNAINPGTPLGESQMVSAKWEAVVKLSGSPFSFRFNDG